MTTRFATVATLTLAVFVTSAAFADAGQRHQGGGGSAAVGRAVPRGGGGSSGGGGGHPGGGGGYPGGGHGGGNYYYGGHYYRPYYGYSGYYGYPYGYYPYGFGLSFGFGYGYPGYGYGYGYPYGGGGYVVNSYGGVRIEGGPRDAAVYADGYYVGTVDDFDGSFQKLNLEPGAHHIEVARQGGAPPASVDVNIHPGQTVTYRVN